MRTLRIALLVSLSCSLPVTAHAAGKKINHPADGYPTIQAAVDAAGCGGAVFLAAGTYNERVLLPCSARLVGAGVGLTILDGTNLAHPQNIPVVGIGNDPFNVFAVQEGFEVSDLTVRAGPNTTAQGMASGWTRRVEIHDVEVIGFRFGIMVDVSTDNKIHHVTVIGRGTTVTPAGACIRFRELNFFRGLLPGGHMTGHSVHHSRLQDCTNGLDVFNSVGTLAYNNTIERTVNGVRLVAVAGSELYQNVISQNQTGLILANANDGVVHHNTLCSNATAILYAESEADEFGIGPSSNNTIQDNTFGSNGKDIDKVDPLLGPGNTEPKNTFGGCS
jgi:nitrous oxidase accessory protein NosD